MSAPGNIDLTCALAVWRYNLARNRRSWKHHILPQLFQPFIYFLGMGFGLGALIETDHGYGYVAFVAPGLLAWAIVQGTSYEVTFTMFVKLVYQRLYDAFLATACEPQDIALGELLWAVTRGFVYGTIFLLVLVAVTIAGIPIVEGWGVVLVPFASILVGIVFALLGELVTCWIGNIDLFNYYYQLGLTPMFMASGIFFPVERIPALAYVVWFTPLYHAVRLLRGLLHTRLGEAELISALWLVVAAALLHVLVMRSIRRRMAS